MRLAVLVGWALIALTMPAAAHAQETTPDPFEAVLTRLNTDPVGARAEIEAMVEAGDVEAMNLLAAILEQDTLDWPAEPERARALLEEAAAGGSSAAQVNLATRLLHETDEAGYARAIALLRQAEQNEVVEPLTWYPWGYAYLFGRGVEQDLTLGAANLWRAVEVHPTNIEAQFLLARAYQNGWGDMDPDPALAYRHMRIAAEGGEARAQWYVGMMLLNGRGVAADQPEAYQFVRMSADAGHLPGMISTAVMLATAEGVAEDDVEARLWYQRAAEQGSAHALRGLGAMLLTGEGGAVDADAGVAYLELAHEAGDELAGQILRQFGAPAATRRAGINEIKAVWLARFGTPTI